MKKMKEKFVYRLGICREEMRKSMSLSRDPMIGGFHKGRWITLKFEARWICDLLRNVAILMVIPSALLLAVR